MLSPILLAITLFSALITPAHSADFSLNSRVLVKGHFKRQCSARVAESLSPGYYALQFDHSSCGDSSVPYHAKQLKNLHFVKEQKTIHGQIHPGDLVTLPGFHGRACGATVKELTKSGYALLESDSMLCADTNGLRKVTELTKVSLVNEVNDFSLGQKVKVPGITQSETCAGSIRKLTSNGLASIEFEQLTCAYGGNLYSLSELQKAAIPSAAPKKRISGDMIFQRVMREIASSKKIKHNAL